MEYCEFRKEIIEKIQELTGCGVCISESVAARNNGVVTEAVLFHDDRSNIAPAIYLRPWYELMKKQGLGMDETAEKIYEVYMNHRENGNIDVGFFVDYGQAKQRIIYSLVNYEMNRGMLEQVPHRRFLDLAVTYSVTVSLHGSMGTIRIKNQHMQMWGIGMEELEECAKENTPKLLGWDFKELYSLVSCMVDMPDKARLRDGGPASQMYVLTNHEKMGGASCILYPGLLEKIAGDLDADLCILPSSTDEVIIIPRTAGMDMSLVNKMIQDINAKELETIEILSDHAYVFYRSEARLRAA